MTNKYKYIKKEFFYKQEFQVSDFFLINANSEIYDEENKSSFSSGVYFKLILKRDVDDLIINLELYAWNNDLQKYLPIKNSIWNDEDFGAGKYLDLIYRHYEKSINNFLKMISELKYIWQLKELIHKLENPLFSFHYKLLKAFSRWELENICKKHFTNYPILNISYFNRNNKFTGNFLLLNYINGFYINGMEVSVDLSDDDFPIYEDEKGKITKEEFLKRVI